MFVNRILDDLCSQGLVRQLKTVIHHGTVSQAVTELIKDVA